ncbi:glycosyltransferase family 9 protein [Microbacterium ureisolvens]|uniref:Glycosyltransferase family 9 protein n=1 Tax=Microbacterium ureisolvens TaxID=2781186 RepID=A0ABS7I4Y7_9MICO|nr:glycosyltransferase family 9 protein [Microbacterium ureisolvens]MBW9111660.1 glycosyltransferase family 9 protein [Microbacterium ureisolvens]
MPDPGDPRDVLLALRALKLGDLLVAVPALRGLRRGFPDHRIVLATSAWLRPIVDLVPAVDELLPAQGLDAPLDVGGRAVDVAVNLHGRGPESGDLLDRLEPRLLVAHRPDAPDGPEWVDGIHERTRWVRLVRAWGAPAAETDVAITRPSIAPAADGAVVVHVGAFYGARRWPVDRFARVARTLSERGHDIVVTAGGEERPRAEAVAEAAGLPEDSVLAGRLDLTGFAALIAASRLVITADTGAAHLASAYRRPSVVLFGPAPPEEWGPPPAGPHIVLTEAALRRGDVFADDPDPALLAVGARAVIAAGEELLAGGGPAR